ncbi:MAG: nuclear transport factor 2 family protein [Planctomycetota bacterium]
MSRRDTLLAAFDAVNAQSPDGIMACWNPDGTYDNPMVGSARTGYDDVHACMVNLVDGLAKTGQTLAVDRVTEGDHHVMVEWHVEPSDGRRGIHVAEFDAEDQLMHVTVYPRST